jgi:hypothetical protein
MSFHSRRLIVLALLVVSIGLLIPGLFAPVLTIRGVLKPEGIAHVAPELLNKGLGDESLANLKTMMNPVVISMVEATRWRVENRFFLQRTGKTHHYPPATFDPRWKFSHLWTKLALSCGGCASMRASSQSRFAP